MPKKRINRKCKHCDKPARRNMSGGRNRGYYNTCGSSECMRVRYTDAAVNRSKGVMKKSVISMCAICGESFKRRTCNHTKYCTTCAPSPKWQRIAKRYKIGKPQWERLYIIQQGSCALCDGKPVFVDHDHITGKVRGLLCAHCNHLIIGIERGVGWIDKANEYLKNQFDYETLKLNLYAIH